MVYHLAEKDTAQKASGNAAAAKTGQTPSGNTAATKTEQKTEPDRTLEINKELARTGVALDAVLERYGVSSIQEMDNATYRKAMSSLRKTKAKAA